MTTMETTASDDASGDAPRQETGRRDMPLVVYVLGLTIFSLMTSEFMVAGMMPSLSAAFGVSVAEVGYLISIYAGGMVLGGPVLTAVLLKLGIPNKRALLALLALYAVGGIVAATADGYGVMVVARVITGVAGSACFGVSLSICADLVRPDARARAASIVLAGLMLATVLGVPAATLIDQHFGWRASFWLVVALAVLCALVIAVLVPASKEMVRASLAQELTAFRNGRLWAAYATSGLIIGAVFAAFSYVSPIFTDVTGFSPAAVPLLLGVYGAANVVGNMVVGRFADRYAIPILVAGLISLAALLVIFALFADHRVVSVAAFVAIGLVGVPMNPAMISRVMKAAHPGPLVNTVHTSVINVGLAAGAWFGGTGIMAGYGLRSPLWIGVALALFGLVTLMPRRFRAPA